MGGVKMAVMISCGYYYIFRDYHMCSHHAHIGHGETLYSPRLFSRVDTWVNPYNCPNHKPT